MVHVISFRLLFRYWIQLFENRSCAPARLSVSRHQVSKSKCNRIARFDFDVKCVFNDRSLFI